jgi:mitochondrial inner membrane protease subunit 1
MLPTFRADGDVVLVNKIGVRYKTGDVVICKSKNNHAKTICKRIAGMPGDIVITHSGMGPVLITVPSGHVWLLGDNPSNSLDSRSYGPVPIDLLQGQVIRKFSLSSNPLQEIK